MRYRVLIIAIAILVVSSIAVLSADKNEWEATGIVINIQIVAISGYEATYLVFEFKNGKNQPIICVAEGIIANAIYRRWQVRNKSGEPCIIGLIGRLRITSHITYIKLWSCGWQPDW